MKFIVLLLSLFQFSFAGLLGSQLSSGHYLFSFKKDADQNSHYSLLESLLGDDSLIGHRLEGLFNGYSLFLGNSLLGGLLDTILGDIADIQEDVEVEAYDVQNDATWNLQRLNQRDALPSNSDTHSQQYKYSYTGTGEGVDVYVIDTGIRTSHDEFEGRASFGYNGTSGDGSDQVHHGTHVAALIGGKTFGTAKKANLISVKVLDANGKGRSSDVLAGVNWAVKQAQSTNKPSIASLSLGGPSSQAMDDIVGNATSNGVHFVVASGNYNEDACSSSPAKVPTAITVGATDIDDNRANFSSYGSCVDLYAPGVDILSASNDNDSATLYLNGSSMSAPMISGLVATIISNEGDLSPQDMQNRLLDLATDNIVGNTDPKNTNAANQTLAYYNPV